MFLELVFCTLLMCADTQTNVVRDTAPVQYFTILDKQILDTLEVTQQFVLTLTVQITLTRRPPTRRVCRPEQIEWGRSTVSTGSHPTFLG